MCLDSDGDGIANCLDPADDGDGIATEDEIAVLGVTSTRMVMGPRSS